MSADFLYLRKFVILKFQHIAQIYAKGEQGNGYLGDNAGVMVFDKCVVTPNIHNGTEHELASF